MSLRDEILKLIKPECEKCGYNTEVFAHGRIEVKCSRKDCEFAVIADTVSQYVDANYEKVTQ